MRTRFIVVYGLGILVLLLDQFTKWWVLQTIPPWFSHTVIPGFFSLINIRNRGAAFGFLNRSDIEWQFWLFLGATLIAVFAIHHMARTAPKKSGLLFAGLGLIWGGAIGNFVDRVRFRAVIDFLDFYIGNYHWPAFNVADMGICVGAGLACLALYRQK